MKVKMIAVLLAAAMQGASGGQPEVAMVFPDFATDYPSCSPHIITGEGFEPGQTEVWVWNPARIEREGTTGLLSSERPVPLPEQPPADARRIVPLDVERQVIVARLEGVVMWVKTSAGLSRPYLFNVAKPFWVSSERAEPGATGHIFGFGLRAPWQPTRVALISRGGQLSAPVQPPDRDYRAEDSTLLYFIIPTNATAGVYDVVVHNGNGGVHGWRKAGQCEVSAAAAVRAEKVFNVRDFGAWGDEVENDFTAIREAMAAAAQAAIVDRTARPIVYFPPGKWRTDTTLVVPAGVTLRGASRQLTVVEGFGNLPQDRRTTALVHPGPGTTLECLTFQGFTVKGPGAYWMALINPPPPKGYDPRNEALTDFTLRNCRLIATERLGSKPYLPYRQALAVPRFRNVKITDNEIFGSVNLGDYFLPSYRLEFIANTIEGGGNTDNVTLNVSQLFESIVDANQLRHAATRFLVNARRHCAIRFNEVHDYQRGIWANAEETFLVHGDVSKSGGRVTGASASILEDSRRKWRPGVWDDAQVLIISGKGFGQHRAVVSNSAQTLTLREPWRVLPDETSQYVVGNYFVENSWHANLNDTPGRMSLWLECIGNMVTKHRDVFAGGIDIWGEDSTRPNEPVQTPHGLGHVDHHFMPAWYNIVHAGWFDGSIVKLWSKVTPGSPYAGPALFGNYIIGNHIRQAHMVRTGFGSSPRIDGGIWIGNRSRPDMKALEGTGFDEPGQRHAGGTNRLIALSHTIVAGNSVSHTPRGISVSDTARKTFILRNEFEGVQIPIVDWGVQTKSEENTIHTLDEAGEHKQQLPRSK